MLKLGELCGLYDNLTTMHRERYDLNGQLVEWWTAMDVEHDQVNPHPHGHRVPWGALPRIEVARAKPRYKLGLDGWIRPV